MERYVAIDNVCAWPNLTLMPNGDIIATIFNQPSHGACEGHAECWASSDGGVMWELRGVPAPHEPDTNRMNLSAGLAQDGTFVVLISGWGMRDGDFRDRIEPAWACLSRDEGRTWKHTDSVAVPEAYDFVIPFGDIECLPDGTLASTVYCCRESDNLSESAYLLFSRDGGNSWGEPVVIEAGDHNETDILRLRADRWLAASRTARDQHVDLFVSEDEGRSWRCQGALSLPGQHPAHLCRLSDGRILLVYGMRNTGAFGVAARLSEDEGESWGPPRCLVSFPGPVDCGYPSSVQIQDGTIVTAWYASRIPSHSRYHMGVCRWRTEE